LLPLVLGCAGKNTVAGEEKTKAELLEAAVPSWCAKTCQRLIDCTEGDSCDCSASTDLCVGVSYDATCPKQCEEEMERWTIGGDVCAAIGERLQDCIDAASCENVGHGADCKISEAEAAACPNPNEDTSLPESVDSTGPNGAYAGTANYGGSSSIGPSVTGGTTSYAGSATYGGTYGVGGSYPVGGTSASGGNSSGPVVTCGDAYGAGGGQPSDTTSAAVLCEEGRADCSDGHVYDWICVQDSQGRRACSCLVDSGVTGGFTPEASCPDLAQVNAACGWNIDTQ
jgi:hypothetical protein